MRAIYFDCFSGISGDMTLGAIIDAGLPLEELQKGLSKLRLPEFELRAERVRKKGISGTQFEVVVEERGTHRHLKEILEIIDGSDLSETAKTRSGGMFRRLAEVEAKIHGTTPDRVHFHEVGGVDSIVDIVGAVVALEILGIESAYSSAVATGEGLVETSHGSVPVPVPATVELLKGVPLRPTGIPSELVTPTGAVLLSSLVREFGRMPPMTVESVGYGAGRKDLEELPNLLRVFIGEVPSEGKTTDRGYIEGTNTVIETNIDNMNPEILGYVVEKLFGAGALDVFITPIFMKKGRPATKLTILTLPELEGAMTDIVFRETTALGVRKYPVVKEMLPREIVEVETEWGKARIKVARCGEEIKNFAPEYEDCRRISEFHNIPLKEVFKAVESAYLKKFPIGT
ncbi:MAG: nickel pincer cofactor biosynthesis protein LarC [bacterium]